MKKIIFILLASTLSFTVAAQNFGDGSTGKRHKSSKPKKQKNRFVSKQKKKKKSKKSETSFYITSPSENNLLCFDNATNKSKEIYGSCIIMNEGITSSVSAIIRRKGRKVF